MQMVGDFFEYLSDMVNKISKVVLLVIMAVMVSAILLQVFFRYVMMNSLPWPEELTVFLMAWMTFIGSGIALRNWEHIGIDLIVEQLPVNIARYVRIFVKLAVIFFAVFIIYTGVTLVTSSHNIISDALRLHLSYTRLCVPIGGLLMLIHAINLLLKDFNYLLNNKGGVKQ